MSIDVADPLERAETILRQTLGERLRTDVPLAPLTSFRIGGPAALYVEPRSEADLAAAGRALRETGIQVALLGKGSNVLVADDGFPGLVIRLGRSYRWAARDGDRLTAGGAMPLPALAGVALRHGLTGLEFGVAIPASLGGAVKMNAGAHEGSMSDVVEGVEVYRLDQGLAERLDGADAGFAYRRSALPPVSVVVGATLALGEGDPSQIRRHMDEARRWRRRTQPLAQPNCGSVFTNPSGDHAARLVEAAGMKGFRSGGASVSVRHANFIVAEPGTRAADVLEVIDAVRSRVIEHDGVTLDLEVQLIGVFEHGT
jgi:UDP-N-acetylmuramate dehydrogenase